jgi:hypothetical protein
VSYVTCARSPVVTGVFSLDIATGCNELYDSHGISERGNMAATDFVVASINKGRSKEVGVDVMPSPSRLLTAGFVQFRAPLKQISSGAREANRDRGTKRGTECPRTP